MTLALIDWIISVGYVLVTIAIGVIFTIVFERDDAIEELIASIDEPLRRRLTSPPEPTGHAPSTQD